MKNGSFVVLNRNIKRFGRVWEQIESYERDENDWELLFFTDDWGGYDIYENNLWGGLIMYDDANNIFISYI